MRCYPRSCDPGVAIHIKVFKSVKTTVLKIDGKVFEDQESQKTCQIISKLLFSEEKHGPGPQLLLHRSCLLPSCQPAHCVD